MMPWHDACSALQIYVCASVCVGGCGVCVVCGVVCASCGVCACGLRINDVRYALEWAVLIINSI